jgi:hypothetical protein
MPLIRPLTDEIVRWVRGDLETEPFEQWVYQQPFEEFRDLIELNYRDRVAVAEMQERLAPELPQRGCYCALILDRQRFLIWSGTIELQFVAPFDKLKLRPPSDALWKCRHCATHWLVARDDDDWVLREALDGGRGVDRARRRMAGNVRGTSFPASGTSGGSQRLRRAFAKGGRPRWLSRALCSLGVAELNGQAPSGDYKYETYRGATLVARYWHDFRDDDHGIQFLDGDVVDGQ